MLTFTMSKQTPKPKQEPSKGDLFFHSNNHIGSLCMVTGANKTDVTYMYITGESIGLGPFLVSVGVWRQTIHVTLAFPMELVEV